MAAALAETEPFTEAAERYTSDEADALVMAESLELSPFNPHSSSQREALYGGVTEVRPVLLRPLHLPIYGRRLLESDQTVQDGGSYKLRGSSHAVLRAMERDPNLQELHIGSAGNAGWGVISATQAVERNTGRHIGVTMESPITASPAKVEPARASGATVHAVHPDVDAALRQANLDGQPEGHATIKPFDAVETIAGQSTAGWETLIDLMGQEWRGEVDLHQTPIKLFVPVGGGGLISGIACVMRWAKTQGIVGDNVQVYGVQMEGCDAMARYRAYLLAGLEPPQDLFAEGPSFNPDADGTAVRQPGKLTRAIVADSRFVADILTVSPGELGLAMADLTAQRGGRRVEPAGALSLAGTRKYAELYPAQPRSDALTELFLTFTTGANVSDELFDRFMVAAAAERAAYGERVRRSYLLSMYALADSGIEHDWDVSAQTELGPVQRGDLRVVSSPVARFK